VKLQSVFRSLGPGIIMGATAIGTSHLVLSPVAGARFGYELLWVILFAHLFKYPAFEFGPRFAIARGVSLIEGYREVPGPRNWAVWVFLFTTVIQGLTVLAAILSVTAAVLYAIVPGPSLHHYVIGLGVVIVALHRTGRYPALSLGSKLALGVLAIVSIVAFVAAPPSPAAVVTALVPRIPDGSLLLMLSIVGLMPTGINVAIWHSLWALEHLDTWKKDAPDRPAMLRLGMFDLKTGYWLSAGLAVIFVCLGAVLLQPRGLTPGGVDVAITLSQIYTEILGDWMYPVFMTAAFAAMFSTAYSVMDGFPRTFSSLLKTLRPANRWLRQAADPAYWLFMALIFLFAIATVLLLPDPVLIVQYTGVISLLVAPVLFGLNYYCVTRLIDDPAMQPGRLLRWWGLAGILLMTGAVLLSLGYRWL
jgi:Mn2+/Fe2+ NRAMP family transporter